ncbi:MAG: S1C family serine protease [Candidatus Rokuibacteriota bacterium]
MSRPRWWRGALIPALSLAFVAAGASAAPRPAAPRFDPGTAQEVPTAVARISPAVVGIRARIPRDRPSVPALGPERWGSGVIIDADGTILTVGYVVLEATGLEVTLRDGRTVPARVLGHDFESGLGVIRLTHGGPYAAATLGRSASVGPGQAVAIVGMAGDRRLLGQAAAVTGVRAFVAYWEYMLDQALIVAPTHPAYGGAALVDPDGAVIGIVSLRLEGEHLAIPIDLFSPVRAAVIAAGRPAKPPRPWLGVRAVAIGGGVVIAGVSPAGPASAAGLREGDVVFRLDGERVADLTDFYRKLWQTTIGRDVELTIHRDGRVETVTVRPRDRHTIFQFRSP